MAYIPKSRVKKSVAVQGEFELKLTGQPYEGPYVQLANGFVHVGTDSNNLGDELIKLNPEREAKIPKNLNNLKYLDIGNNQIYEFPDMLIELPSLIELSLDSNNIDSYKNNMDPNIQRFMGELNGKDHPHLGSKLGLGASWSYDIVKQVGNYKQIYKRNIGVETPLRLKRGLNRLYIHGGLLYAPPLK